METLSAKEAIEELIPLLEQTVGAEKIYSQLEEVSIPIGMGMSLAIMVNELVTNAVKHGGHKVELSLSAEGEVAKLEVCDDGVGFLPDFDPVKSANVGLSLIEQISRWDLRGNAAYNNRPGGGACVTVTFPMAPISYALVDANTVRGAMASGSKVVDSHQISDR